MSEHPGGKPHFTTRRGFIAAAGFGVVGLYGLWAAYGAAPLNLLAAGVEPEASGGGHGGHEVPDGGPDVEEFKRRVEQFIAANQLPDGSVRPGPMAMASPAMAGHGTHGGPEPTAGGGAAENGMHGAGHGAESPSAADQPATDHAEGEAVEVYLMAYQWGYKPAVLRLEANVPYRFRMMAVDTTHGASFHLGNASRITRLRPKTLVEQQLKFTRPGEYLLYCTVYCGLAHDRMQGKIIVTESRNPESSHESAPPH